jgi:cellulose synthase/poly-beta-1,6-N-acetylglucosamine synthase-like glycosyltransferase
MKNKSLDNWPMVTVMIAARNETQNILNCLNSLLDQNYPINKLQILIGNDASEDKTFEIINDFCKQYAYFEVVNVFASIGKVNVLVELQKKAKGEIYLFTDADVVLNANWVKSMVAKFDTKTGIVTGVTILKGQNIFAQFQSLEWLYTFFVLKTASLFNIPLTSIGNNMAISKRAYLQIGGFENLEGTLVEDFAIFKKIINANFTFVQCFEIDTLIETVPKLNLKAVLNQRKRWMIGAKQLPWFFQGINYCAALFLPFIFILSYVDLAVAIQVFVIKYLIISALSFVAILEVKKWKYLLLLPFFDFYLSGIYFTMFIYDLFCSEIEWKGRIYKK